MDSLPLLHVPCMRLSMLSLAIASVVAFPLSVLAQNTETASTDTEFDAQTIKARGLDPAVAQMFKKAPHFMQGTSLVALTVNGSSKGKFEVRFDKEGQLCPDAAFFKTAGLITPPGFDEKAACFDLKSAWPQTELSLDPGEGKVDVVVPGEALAAPGQDIGSYEHGGIAGLLNYDAQYMGSSGSSTGTDFEQLDTEAGFNVSDWIVRSRQNMSRLNGETTIQHQAAYAQRTFADIQKVFQAGQVSLANSMFSTGQVLGFQMFPEAALQNSRGGAAVVEGIADTQSVAEVRQSGVLLYTTTVPAGPFHLQDFPLLNTRSDLNVKLTGNNGEVREFTVPAAAFMANGVAVDTGLSFGAGKLDQDGSDESPILGTVSRGWAITDSTSLNAGLLGSSPYQAGALSLNSELFSATLVSVQTTLAQDNEHDDSGLSGTVNLTHYLTERISLNGNLTQQTPGYRELSEALDHDYDRSGDLSRNQYGAGINWSEETLGTLSLSWANTTTFDGETTTYIRGGWSRQIGQTYVSASLEHNSGGTTMDGDDRVYVTMSIPFGNQNVSNYYTHSDSGSQFGTRYSNRTSRDRGWSIAADRDQGRDRTNLSGSVDMVTPVSQLSANVSRDSDNFTSWSGHASGSAVFHPHGVTLAPYRVADTFGIAKVGEESGIRLETPSGPTWTNSNGYAVLPSLSHYRRSTVQVDTRSLGKNIDISNAWQETELAHGAVGFVNFGVIRTRRVLVTLLDAQGKPVPHGDSVFDAAGEFVTVVGENGKTFIPDSQPGMRLDVQSSGKTTCSFTLSLPEKTEAEGLFETANATCK